jgi:hypothetical protein
MDKLGLFELFRRSMTVLGQGLMLEEATPWAIKAVTRRATLAEVLVQALQVTRRLQQAAK